MYCSEVDSLKPVGILASGGCTSAGVRVAAMRRDMPDDTPNTRDNDQFSSGNMPSFEDTLGLYHKKIFNLAYRLLGNMDDAADLTQETFIKAYKAYPGFRGDSSALYSWLCKITVNGCKNRFIDMNRRGRHEAFSLDEPINPEDSGASIEFGDDSANPAGIFERKELEVMIQEAIQELPPEYRIIVVLRDMFGLSYKEIADTVNLSVDLVKVRLHRGRSAIRRRLLPYIDE